MYGRAEGMDCPSLAGMAERDERPRCDGCGDAVGVYEPIWLEHAGGTLRRSSILALSGEERAQARRGWHVGCVATTNGRCGRRPRNPA
jgi:hypothetical protein